MKAGFLLTLFFMCYCVSAFPQEATKIEEFEDVDCEMYLRSIEQVVAGLKNDPSSMMHVFVYEGRVFRGYDDPRLVAPNVGLAKAKIRSMRRWLRMRKFPLDRFLFINAGFREKFTVEFWLVPNGSLPPKPSPTLTKMRYRKGKAQGFCFGCCG